MLKVIPFPAESARPGFFRRNLTLPAVLALPTFLCVLGACPPPSAAQAAASSYPVVLSVAKATLGTGLPPTVGPTVDQRLSARLMVSREEAPPGHGFFVQAQLDLLESYPLEGIQTRTAAKVLLTLVLRNHWDDTPLATWERTLSGIGTDLSAAVTQALLGIGKGSASLQQVREEFEATARTYLDANCSNLTMQAETMLGSGEPGDAFAFLQALPPGSPCRTSAEQLVQEAYSRYQHTVCEQLLLRAATRQAGMDYRAALRALAAIDVTSPCAERAGSAVRSLQQSIDEQLRQEYDWLLQVHKTAAAGEAARWKAMEALFLHWLQQNTPAWRTP
ncbi:MAG: hypothetical protein RLY31_2799 [Bacteroidota bacterium]